MWKCYFHRDERFLGMVACAEAKKVVAEDKYELLGDPACLVGFSIVLISFLCIPNYLSLFFQFTCPPHPPGGSKERPPQFAQGGIGLAVCEVCCPVICVVCVCESPLVEERPALTYRLQLPGLFDGCQFHFDGSESEKGLPKSVLEELVALGGGTVRPILCLGQSPLFVSQLCYSSSCFSFVTALLIGRFCTANRWLMDC